MEDQKLENLLNLALSATEEERIKSESLNIGYNPAERTWELIVRHSGSLAGLASLGVQVDELLNGYAVLVVPENLIDALSSLNQIEFVEKPKRLFFASNGARAASCLSTVQPGVGGGGVVSGLGIGLTGRGVLVAVIDSGIDYFHEDFRNEDGTTRILMLMDQNRDRVYSSEEINEALAAPTRAQALELVPSTDLSGHGTAVAAIAAGNGREGRGVYRGVAYESRLLVVKLGTPLTDNFPRTTQLMKALDFVVRQAEELGMPVAVNLSFGNTYGSHDGTSLLETFMNDISNYGRSVLVAGTGNEGAAAGHTGGRLVTGQETDVELSVAPFETGMGIQLWKSYVDSFAIRLITPSGDIIGPVDSRLGPQTLTYGGTRILIYYGKPSPYASAQEVYFDFIPVRDYLDSGIWTFRLNPERIVTGRYDMWLPSRGILNPSTRFLMAVPETTLTIPSTAANVISVGAYDDSYRAYADFSGRGFTRETNQVKPDLAAPGVDIVTARRGGGYEAVTGTSFAAPFVTGSAALLMQWGILEENDRFLYGEKVKANLQRGARHLPGYDVWPNPQLGYGVLCVADSLPL